MTVRPMLIVGNWKMNGLTASVAELDQILAALPSGIDVGIHPPLTLLTLFAAHSRGRIIIGGQDVAPGTFGPHTGEVSATMLVDAGARAVIVGHSERRENQCETDELVRGKAAAAIGAGLLTIVCVGETRAEHDAGEAPAVIARQLGASFPPPGVGELAVAYEPIWAIGSGQTPTLPQVAEVHAGIRAIVGAGTRILYGGSVNASNAAELLGLADVDGALVGGASLKANDFLGVLAGAALAVQRG